MKAKILIVIALVGVMFFGVSNYSFSEDTTTQDESQEIRTVELILEGRNLSQEQVEELEKVLEEDEDDLPTRIKLIGFYDNRSYDSEEYENKYVYHVLWVIKNRPESTLAGLPFVHLNTHSQEDDYNNAKEIWLEHLENDKDNLNMVTFIHLEAK